MGRDREREEETFWPVASLMPPNGDLAHNTGMYPDWESDQKPFILQAEAQSPKQH